MKRFFRDNGLSLTLFALFVLTLVGQALTGWRAHAQDLQAHNLPDIPLLDYLRTGHFVSAVFENWESEFLQMAVYVVFTAILIQKGSPESRDPEKADEQEKEALAHAARPDTPWPVKKGGVILTLYSHSLSIALVILFAVSFGLHLTASNKHANEEAALNQQPLHAVFETMVDPQFWYESFQNWQSEFLSIAALLVLSIFLRERGSPESKPVSAPHSMTGQ